jgi:hypothetical protein
MSNFGSLFLDEKIHDATLNTADALGISSEIVLKDHAVFGVLKALFEDSPKDISDRLVFKGGTSLSKAYRLIDRFSEDVDLAFLYHRTIHFLFQKPSLSISDFCWRPTRLRNLISPSSFFSGSW